MSRKGRSAAVGRRANNAKSATSEYERTKEALPCFSLKRRVLPTEETIEVMQRLEEVMPEQVQVRKYGRLAMTIIENNKMQAVLKKAELTPSVSRMRGIAYALRDQLADLSKYNSERSQVPVGDLEIFGNYDNCLSVRQANWQGFLGSYSDLTEDGRANKRHIRDTNIALGVMATAFTENEFRRDRDPRTGLVDTRLDVANLSVIPHITIAKHSEMRQPIEPRQYNAAANILSEYPDFSFELGDPVITLSVGQGRFEHIPISESVEFYAENIKINER